MKTIVYLHDGSIEATSRADEIVASGSARYATVLECRSYEDRFEQDDAAMREAELQQEERMLHGDSGPSQPSYDE